MLRGVIVFLSLFLCGCSFVDYNDSRMTGSAVDLPVVDYRFDFKAGEVLISGSSVRIDDVAMSLAAYGVKMTYGQGFDKPVKLDISGKYSIVEIMRVLENAYSCHASKSGGVWVLERDNSSDGGGKVSPLNHVSKEGTSSVSASLGGYVYYFRVWGFSEDEVMQRLSSYGVQKLGNFLYYCRNDLQHILELDELVYNMLLCVPVQYYFTVYFLSEDVLRDVGLNINPSVSGMFSSAWAKAVDMTYDYKAALNVVLDSTFDLSSKKGVRKIGGVVREGHDFTFRIGDEIPIAKKTVSDSGTVSDTGYEYQRFGFSVKVRVEGRSYGMLTLSLENTDIGGYVGGYPVRHGSNLDTVLVISDNRRVYVGSCLMDSLSWSFLGRKRQRQYYHVVLQCDVVEAGQIVESLKEI